MNKRLNILSIALLVSFILMVGLFSFSQKPNFVVLFAIALLTAFFSYIVYRSRKHQKKQTKNNSLSYLPPIAKESRFVRIIFSCIALAVIITAAGIPVFFLVADFNSIINYFENYSVVHFLVLCLLMLPFVLKNLDD